MSESALRTRRRPRAPPARAARPLRVPAASLRQMLAQPVAARLQPRLTVGAANDPAEREADQVADRVLSGGLREAPVPAAPDGPAAPRRSVEDQPSLDEIAREPPLPEALQDVDLSATEDVVTDGIGEGELGELTSGEPVALPDEPASPPDPPPPPEERLLLSRATAPAVGPEGGAAPTAVDAAIRAPGPGRPLPTPVRREMNCGFGAEFADVRLHDRPADRAVAAAIGARAFAFGADVWLGPGERAEDRRLIAHELAHVVQQTGRGRAGIMNPGRPAAPAPRRQGVVGLISEAVLAKVASYARYVPGYALMTVILGRDPITGETVPRDAETLVLGFLSLLPGGPILGEKLREAGALAQASDWVAAQLSRLNITPTRASSAVDRARELFALRSPVESIKPAFAPLYDDVLRFAAAMKEKVLELIVRGALRLAGPHAEQVWAVIQNAREAIGLILEDPLGFAKNLVRAVAQGFGLFATNVLTHLKKGLLGFLFGSLKGVDLTLPERLDLKGILSILFQILGLTWERIRALLVKRLGPKGEKVMAFIEGSVDVVRILVAEGVLGVWQKLLGMIENLRQTVVGGLMEYVTGALVKGAVGWLAGLSNPIGTVVKVVLMIYDFIVAFLERMQQIRELAGSIFASLAEIARGGVSTAAAKVEEAIGRTVPLVLAFVAALIPVTGIASKIQSIFRSLRRPVDDAISRFVGFVVRKAKKLLAKLIAKLNGKRKLPRKSFRIGRKVHHLEAVRKGGRVALQVSSDTITVREAVDQLMQDQGQAEAAKIDPAEIEDVVRFVAAFKKGAEASETAAGKVRPEAANEPQSKAIADLDASMTLAASDITSFGLKLEEKKGVVTDDRTELLRFVAPITGFEGQADTYANLAKAKEKHPEMPRRIELDHNPARAVLRRVQGWLRKVQKTAKGRTEKPVYFKPAEANDRDAAATGAAFGLLSVVEVSEKAPEFPALAIYGPHNGAMSEDDARQGLEMQSTLDALGPDDAGEVKKEIMAKVAQKLDKVVSLYAKDPTLSQEASEKLRKNVAAGGSTLRALAAEKLKLAPVEAVPEQPREKVGGLVRKLALTGDGSGGTPDFILSEGLAGTFDTVSLFSSRSFLEADHNPINRDMELVETWTYGHLLGEAKEVAAIKGTQAYKDLSQTRQRWVVSRFKEALEVPVVSTRHSYSRGLGGAVVVSRDVNQDAKMKEADPDFLSGLQKPVQARITDDVREKMARHLGRQAKVDTARSLVGPANAAIRTEMGKRIRARQKLIFSLYASKEAPEIKRINDEQKPGQGDKAVGELARIAARMRNAEATGKLCKAVNRVFPEPP